MRPMGSEHCDLRTTAREEILRPGPAQAGDGGNRWHTPFASVLRRDAKRSYYPL